MGKGYMGKVLWVDLGTGVCRDEVIPDEVYGRYLSGLGLAAHLLYERIPAGADALGPDNILGIMSGMLTGTGSLFTGRWMVVGKSPLTGGWGDANCGGTFSPAIKRCGYDGLFFTGISDKPVYLYVDGKSVELRDASHVWGKDAVVTEEELTQELGPRAHVVCIGPAGEKLSLIAGVCNDRGRIAARSGLGAVMGSKRLKAVVCAGAQRIAVHDKAEMKHLSATCNTWVQKQPPLFPGKISWVLGSLMRKLPFKNAMDGMMYKIFLRKWGTVSMNQISVEIGDAPIKNWDGSNEDFGHGKSKHVNPDVFTNRETVKYHCYACPLGCGGICSIKGKYKETHKPEYETVLALGGLCMNEDADSIFYLNEVLNRAGMDTISAGGTVAFAIECYERGILTKEDTGGLELTWGNTKAIVELIHKMVNREGIGNLLADGTKVASAKIGKGSEAFAIHAGGQELPMHDGRNEPGFAVHYCVEPTPGRHTIGSGSYYEMFRLWEKAKSLPGVKQRSNKNLKYVADKEKAIHSAACSKFTNVINGSGACMFGSFLGVIRTPIFDWLNAATGWSKTPEEYLEIGARIQTTKQAFNVKHGIDPKTYQMHKRAAGIPPLTIGANKGRTLEIEKMMHDYWAELGWDTQSGKPTQESMKRLGIV